MAAVFRDAKHFLETGDIVVEMLDDIECGSDIECFVCVGKSLGETLLYRQSFTSTELERIVGHVDALGRAELREHLEIRAGPAADVENLRILGFRFWILDYSF